MLKSLAIREMEIKAKMGEHVTPVSITIIKEANYNERGQDCGETGTLPLHLWDIKRCSRSGGQLAVPHKSEYSVLR